jgi:Ca2+-dependent lipid-binding protein
MGVLTVYLEKCTNLANKDLATASDPYVIFSLEQDNWVRDVDYGSQRSSTKSDNLNPVWGETFTFTIPTIDNMVLTCKLRDDDIGSRHDKLGWCKIKLEELGLTTSPKAVDYIIDQNLVTAHGKIFLKLSYKS